MKPSTTSKSSTIIFDPLTLHVKRRKILRMTRTLLGDHGLTLFHKLQLAVTKSKLTTLGDGVEPLLSYLKHNEAAKPFMVPIWARMYFASFFPVLVLQSKEEITRFTNLVSHLKPKRVLEVGTWYGGTLAIFTKVAADDAQIISLDIDHSDWRMKMYRTFARANQVITPVKADSHSLETLTAIKKILGGGQLDLLFIDGDHSYNGVRRDYEMYSPLVQHGGVIAFHDIHPRFALDVCGVWKLWEELKPNYRYTEFLGHDRPGEPLGIGVLFV